MPDTIQHTPPKVDTTAIRQHIDTSAGERNVVSVNHTTQIDSLHRQTIDVQLTSKPKYADTLCIAPDYSQILFTPVNDTITPIAEKQIYPATSSEVYGWQSVQQYDNQNVQPFVLEKDNLIDIGLVVFMLYLSVVIIFSRDFFRSFSPLLFSYQKAHKHFDADSQSSSFSRRMFFVPSILSTALYLFFAYTYLYPQNSDIGILPKIIAALLVIAVFKHVLLVIIGSATFTQSFIKELLFSRQLYMVALCLFLSPIVVFQALYNEYAVQSILLWLGGGLMLSIVVAFIMRTGVIFRSMRISAFLWILYLCIVEIVPYLALYILSQ